MTKIEDADGGRNEQILVRNGNRWFNGDMYVYCYPTHWRELSQMEKLRLKNEAERKAIDQMERIPLACTAKEGDFEALKRGWHAFAKPAVIDDAARQEFADLAPAELAELFQGWVGRSIDGVQGDFMKHDKPQTYFTVRQISDLWAIINKDKEGKVDASADSKEERSDQD